MRVLGGAVLVAAVTVVLTGCGSQAAQPTSAPSITLAPSASAAPTAPATPAETERTTPDATPTSAATSGGPGNQCPDDDLGVGVVPGDGGGAAGSESYEVLITNAGGTSCALRGTPEVAVVRDGAPLGKPAARTGAAGRTLLLRVGDTVAAPLTIVRIGTDGGPLDGCTVQRGTGYRVVPPHSSRGFAVQDPSAVACAPGPSFMTVGPLVRLAR